MSKKVLILDGDSIAYRCSAVGEKRSIRVTHTPSGKEKVFKHRTEFKESMSEKGKEITPDYVVADCQEPEPLSYVLSTIRNHIERVADEVKPDKIEIFAGERFNFRTDLPLPKKYKGQRINSIRPIHLNEAKQYLRSKYKAKEAVGMEVDDAQSIAAYDALKSKHDPVMYFYEKDQCQLDGVTLLFDEDEGFRYEVVPKLGHLRLEKTTVKGMGLKFLAYQWICSDPVDNYCAYDLSSLKFGPKSAYNTLVDLSCEKSILKTVIEQFKKFYPEPFEYTSWNGIKHQSNWESMMRMYFKACRMMRSQDDPLNPDELFKQYEVEINDR
jgi:hypothetical protein